MLGHKHVLGENRSERNGRVAKFERISHLKSIKSNYAVFFL